MSYDVFMQAFHSGGPGEGDREGALRVIRRLGERAKPQATGFDVEFPDGGAAEMYCGKLAGEEGFHSCMFAIHSSFSRDLAQFIYEFGRDADMVLIQPDEGGKSATFACTREEQLAHIAELSGTQDCPKVVVTSGEEVFRLLKGGYTEWLKFAKKVQDQGVEEGKPAKRAKKRR